MDETWTVVQFKDEDAVEAVPTKWIINNSCYWPSFSREKLLQYIKKNEEPNTCWPMFSIKSFRNSTYSDYLVARQKAKIAETTSDLNNSDTEKRRIKKKYLSSSDDSSASHDESEIPNPPQFKKTTSIRRQAQTNEKNKTHCEANIQKAPLMQKDETPTSISQVIELEKDQLLKDLIRKQNVLYAFFKQMNDDIQEIKIKLSDLKLPGLPAVMTNKTSIFKIFNFPLKSYDELNQFEIFLEDDEKFEAMVCEISQLGGSCLYEFIKRALSIILCNSLAEQFTWFGVKEKKPFKDLKYAQVLIRASEIFDNKVTKKEIEENIRKWLRRARERKDYVGQRKRQCESEKE